MKKVSNIMKNKCTVCGANCDLGDKCWRHKIRQPLKSSKLKVRKKSLEEIQENKELRSEDLRVYNEVWNERSHICVSCGIGLGNELKTYHIEHCLPKSVYPQYRHDKRNLFLICLDCHTLKENSFPTEKYAQIIKETKELFGVT